MSLIISTFKDNQENQKLQAYDNGKNKETPKTGKSIFIGNLNNKFSNSSLIEQKQQIAQKQAMKLIGDAWVNDQKTEKRIDVLKQRKVDDIAKIEEGKSYLSVINDTKTTLQKEYGVDTDSQEQKDLELLEKFQDYKAGVAFDHYSEEEIYRLRELQNIPRTEYQNKILELNAQAGVIQKESDSAENKLLCLQESITDAKNEQLKSQNMQNAQDASDEIMGAANKDILALLIQDSKDNLDEKMKEDQEKAKEAKEKEKEQEERIDESKKKREEQEELLQDAAEMDKMEVNTSTDQQSTNNVEVALKNIKKIMKENDFIDEDLKGIKIDFNF